MSLISKLLVVVVSVLFLFLSGEVASACPLDPGLVQAEVDSGVLSQATVSYMGTLPVQQRLIFLSSFTPSYDTAIGIHTRFFGRVDPYIRSSTFNLIRSGAFFRTPFGRGGVHGRFTSRGRFIGRGGGIRRGIGFRSRGRVRGRVR
jgi:hypothetical protein